MKPTGALYEMKGNILLLAISLVCYSCSDEEDLNPNFSWMEEKIEELENLNKGI